jgi:hypothetical protein
VLEFANVEQQLVVGNQSFARPSDGLEIVRILEALNNLLLK